jgi:succinate dehydrogenase / fumarate reductase iron-sulfur subunit
MLVKLKIFRYDPQKDKEPYYQTYEVEADPMERLLDCLNRIRWEQDPTLSYRWSCGHGVCGSDGVRINGICGLPCQKLVKDLKEEVLIEPLPVFKVIKDLIVDLDPFFEKYNSIKPYLITLSTSFALPGYKNQEQHFQRIAIHSRYYRVCLAISGTSYLMK